MKPWRSDRSKTRVQSSSVITRPWGLLGEHTYIMRTRAHAFPATESQSGRRLFAASALMKYGFAPASSVDPSYT